MAVLFANELGGDFVLMSGVKGSGQLMVTIRSINVGLETAVLVVRENWDLTNPAWSDPTIVEGTVASLAPSILGPLGDGKVVIVYIDTTGNLTMKWSTDGGETWYS